MTHQDAGWRPGAPHGEIVGLAAAVGEAWQLASQKAGEQECEEGGPLDELVHGILPGELLAICGQKGVGKTSFVLKTAVEAARKGSFVLFCSLESSAADIGRRLISIETGVPLESLACSEEGTSESDLLIRTMDQLSALDLFIVDDFSLDCDHLEAMVCEHARRSEKLLVIVDRADLLDIADFDNDGLALKYLKRIAGKACASIVAVFGFDENDYKYRAKEICGLTDVALSIAPWGPVNVRKLSGDVTKISVLKNRRGPSFECEYWFDPESQRFIEYQRIHDATELLSGRTEE